MADPKAQDLVDQALARAGVMPSEAAQEGGGDYTKIFEVSPPPGVPGYEAEAALLAAHKKHRKLRFHDWWEDFGDDGLWKEMKRVVPIIGAGVEAGDVKKFKAITEQAMRYTEQRKRHPGNANAGDPITPEQADWALEFYDDISRDKSFGYMAGEGSLESARFGLEFYLMGGLGRGANAYLGRSLTIGEGGALAVKAGLRGKAALTAQRWKGALEGARAARVRDIGPGGALSVGGFAKAQAVKAGSKVARAAATMGGVEAAGQAAKLLHLTEGTALDAAIMREVMPDIAVEQDELGRVSMYARGAWEDPSSSHLYRAVAKLGGDYLSEMLGPVGGRQFARVGKTIGRTVPLTARWAGMVRAGIDQFHKVFPGRAISDAFKRGGIDNLFEELLEERIGAVITSVSLIPVGDEEAFLVKTEDGRSLTVNMDSVIPSLDQFLAEAVLVGGMGGLRIAGDVVSSTFVPRERQRRLHEALAGFAADLEEPGKERTAAVQASLDEIKAKDSALYTRVFEDRAPEAGDWDRLMGMAAEDADFRRGLESSGVLPRLRGVQADVTDEMQQQADGLARDNETNTWPSLVVSPRAGWQERITSSFSGLGVRVAWVDGGAPMDAHPARHSAKTPGVIYLDARLDPDAPGAGQFYAGPRDEAEEHYRDITPARLFSIAAHETKHDFDVRFPTLIADFEAAVEDILPEAVDQKVRDYMRRTVRHESQQEMTEEEVGKEIDARLGALREELGEAGFREWVQREGTAVIAEGTSPLALFMATDSGAAFLEWIKEEQPGALERLHDWFSVRVRSAIGRARPGDALGINERVLHRLSSELGALADAPVEADSLAEWWRLAKVYREALFMTADGSGLPAETGAGGAVLPARDETTVPDPEPGAGPMLETEAEALGTRASSIYSDLQDVTIGSKWRRAPDAGLKAHMEEAFPAGQHDGECLRCATQMAVHAQAETGSGEYVEGTVTSPLDGRAIHHAWAESNGVVYDPATGIAASREEYDVLVGPVTELHREPGAVHAGRSTRAGRYEFQSRPPGAAPRNKKATKKKTTKKKTTKKKATKKKRGGGAARKPGEPRSAVPGATGAKAREADKAAEEPAKEEEQAAAVAKVRGGRRKANKKITKKKTTKKKTTKKKTTKKKAPKGADVYKGDFYFETREGAEEWAKENAWPTEFIRKFERGYAVQAGNSGSYAGSDGRPPQRPQRRSSLSAAMRRWGEQEEAAAKVKGAAPTPIEQDRADALAEIVAEADALAAGPAAADAEAEEVTDEGRQAAAVEDVRGGKRKAKKKKGGPRKPRELGQGAAAKTKKKAKGGGRPKTAAPRALGLPAKPRQVRKGGLEARKENLGMRARTVQSALADQPAWESRRDALIFAVQTLPNRELARLHRWLKEHDDPLLSGTAAAFVKKAMDKPRKRGAAQYEYVAVIRDAETNDSDTVTFRSTSERGARGKARAWMADVGGGKDHALEIVSLDKAPDVEISADPSEISDPLLSHPEAAQADHDSSEPRTVSLEDIDDLDGLADARALDAAPVTLVEESRSDEGARYSFRIEDEKKTFRLSYRVVLERDRPAFATAPDGSILSSNYSLVFYEYDEQEGTRGGKNFHLAPAGRYAPLVFRTVERAVRADLLARMSAMPGRAITVSFSALSRKGEGARDSRVRLYDSMARRVMNTFANVHAKAEVGPTGGMGTNYTYTISLAETEATLSRYINYAALQDLEATYDDPDVPPDLDDDLEPHVFFSAPLVPAQRARFDAAGFDAPAYGDMDMVVQRLQNSLRHLMMTEADAKRWYADNASRKTKRLFGDQLPEDALPYRRSLVRKRRTASALEDITQRRITPLIKGLAKAGIQFGSAAELGNFSHFLTVKHAPSRNRFIRENRDPENLAGSGMKDADAAAAMRHYRRLDNYREYEKHAEMLYALLAETRQNMVDYGLISQEQKEKMEAQWEFYVPLRTLDLEESLGIGAGADLRSSEFMTALGRHTLADDPLSFAIAQAGLTIVRGEKARVGQALLKMIRLLTKDQRAAFAAIDIPEKRRGLHGTTGFVSDELKDWRHWDRPEVVVVREGGKLHAITFSADHVNLARAIKGANAVEAGAVIHFFGSVNRYLAGVNTRWNPVFPIFNSIRDAGGAFMVAGVEHGFGFASSVLAGIPTANAALARYHNLGRIVPGGKPRFAPETNDTDALLKRWVDAGGPIAHLHVDSLETQFAALQKQYNEALGGGPGRVRVGARAVGEYISNVNDVFENGARFAFFARAVAEPAAGGLGMTDMEAAAASKDLTTNFETGGDARSWINAFVLFGNAGIQGLDKGLRVAKLPGAKKAFATALTAHTLISLSNALMGGVDPEDGERHHDKIPDYIKRRSLILMSPAGDGDYIAVPMPFVYGFVGAAGNFLGDLLSGAKTANDAAVAITEAFIDQMNPLGGGPDVMDVFTPTAIRPYFQIKNNRDWKGAQIRPEDHGRPVPDSELYFEGVTPTLRDMMRAVNAMTGGNEARSGVVDVSPETVEHMAGFATGGAGKVVLRTARVIDKIMRGEEVPWEGVPLARRLVGSAKPYHVSSQYRQYRDAVDQAVTEYKGGHRTEKEVEWIIRMLPAKRAVETFTRRATRLKGTLPEDDPKIAEINELIRTRRAAFNKAFIQKAKAAGQWPLSRYARVGV